MGKAIIRQYRKGLLQWGSSSSTSTSHTITFPITFNNVPYAAIATSSSAGSGEGATVQWLNWADHMILSSQQSNRTVFWVAIGR